MPLAKSIAIQGSAEERRRVPEMNARPRLKSPLRIASAYAAIALLSAWPYSAEGGPLKIHTNQEMIEELLTPNDLDAKNPNAVFEAVFTALPSKVTVYPTESYYYFTFFLNGIAY